MNSERKEIRRLRKVLKEYDDLYKKTYQVNEFTISEKEDIRFLLRQKMTEMTTKIRQIKRELKENETITQFKVGQIFEHEFFEDEIEITNIYVENGKVMIETRFKVNLFEGEPKTSISEYETLIKRFNGNYVLIKE